MEAEHGGGGGSFEFTPEMVASYREPDELTRLASTATKAETLKRIGILRGIPK